VASRSFQPWFLTIGLHLTALSMLSND
jgi:hypothetical protein